MHGVTRPDRYRDDGLALAEQHNLLSCPAVLVKKLSSGHLDTNLGNSCVCRLIKYQQ